MASPNDKHAAAAVPAPEVVETPDVSKGASILTKVAWPASVFRVESVPEITREGTMLTAAQLKTAEDAAKKSGVSLLSTKNEESGDK